MSDFEKAYQAACESGLLPGVVLMASGKNGKRIACDRNKKIRVFRPPDQLIDR